MLPGESRHNCISCAPRGNVLVVCVDTGSYAAMTVTMDLARFVGPRSGKQSCAGPANDYTKSQYNVMHTTPCQNCVAPCPATLPAVLIGTR